MRQWARQIPGVLSHCSGGFDAASAIGETDGACSLLVYWSPMRVFACQPADICLASVPQYVEVPGLYQVGAYLPTPLFFGFVYVPFLVSGF